MTKFTGAALLLAIVLYPRGWLAGQEKPAAKGVSGSYLQEGSVFYGVGDGLPSADARAVAAARDGEVYAGTAAGLARHLDGRWGPVEGAPAEAATLLAAAGDAVIAAVGGALYEVRGPRAARLDLELPAEPSALAADGSGIWIGSAAGLFRCERGRCESVREAGELLGGGTEVRQIAVSPDGAVAVAAAAGLLERRTGASWRRLLPAGGGRSWAPIDARGAAYDGRGRLWFACGEGIGRRDGEAWTLFTAEDGLPCDDFTSVAAGAGEAIWLGTRLGAIRCDGRAWEYRQGRRWVPDDRIRAAAVDPRGRAWFATAAGIGMIARRPMTLAEKARFYEEEIDRYHRRTPYGFVAEVSLARPGDKSAFTQHDTDNDGLWTGMYGAGECFAYAATGDPRARERARAAFEALRFLVEVTGAGEHPAPRGFPARSVLPTTGPDPNSVHTREEDERRRREDDALWKVIHPRWPKSAGGKWYWKCDTSSDELAGHYFLYSNYYDLAAETEEEKRRVRETVAAVTDHLLANDFRLIDWDGKPTRWANFSPASLNADPDWYEERGLNSLSILSHLKAAEHVTGDARYGRAARELVDRHHYDINLLVPKIQSGPGSNVQFDDELAFMNYYSLLKYEKDPRLRQLAAFSFHRYWLLERCERNPFFNFLYAAAAGGETFTSPFRTIPLAPAGPWLEESMDALRRFPLDLVDWRCLNSRRSDILPLPGYTRPSGGARGRGCRLDGTVLPVDERFFRHWDHDPWILDTGGEGRGLASGATFLLAYYLGLHHGYIARE